MKYFLFAISQFILISHVINAHYPVKFIRYNTNDGLVSNDVLCISQDKYGFIWFGTKTGCSRFDGMEFKSFTYNPEIKGSINEGWVNDIVPDKNNNLWFGLGSSIMVFDYNNECFHEILLQLSDSSKAINISCHNLLIDTAGLLWITSNNNSVYVIDPISKKVANHFLLEKKTATPIVEDDIGNIWMGTSFNGLLRYNRGNNTFSSFMNNPDDRYSLSHNSIQSLYKDSEGDIWIGTWGGGLNKIIREPEYPDRIKFKTYKHNNKNPSSISYNYVYSIIEDQDNNFWIGTLKGLGYLDVESDSFTNYFYDDRDIESINDNIIRTFYFDNTGDLWIGTGMGAARLKKERFRNFRYSSYKNSIRSNKVQCLFVDHEQDIYVGTPMGIDIYSSQSDKFRVFLEIKKGQTSLSGPPNIIFQDINKDLWIGAWDGDLLYYNTQEKKLVQYVHNKNNGASPRIDRVFTICEDNDYNLWFGTWGAGIDILDRNQNSFSNISAVNDTDHGKLSSGLVSCIVKDSMGQMWVGTRNGLNLITGTGPYRFKHYLTDKDKTRPIGFSNILCIHEGRYPFIWIGSEFGLHRLNRATDEVLTFSKKDGMPSLSVQSIQEDAMHNIWLGTGNGLAKLSLAPDVEPKQSLKSDYTIKTFRKEDGLQNQYLERSFAKMKDGTLLFGGKEGFSMFHPDDIVEDTVSPPVVITNVQIANTSVDIGKKVNKQVVLHKSLQCTDSLKLNYKNNNITIEFAGLYFIHPETYTYAYKLVGFDEKWNITNARNRKATYTNLPYNTFTLLIKASNHDGVWTGKMKKLVLQINPPWWLTLWFKICCVALLIAFVILWIKIRTNSLKKQKQILEKQVEDRTAELKVMNLMLNERKEELEQQADAMAEMNKTLVDTNTSLESKTKEVEFMAKKIHDADQKQLRFFANISHEFRTPLSLIIGPLEKLIENKAHINLNKPEGYFILMHRNAQRLLRLINQIIDFRKIDQGEKKLHISNNNIIEFITEIKDAFSVQAEAKRILLEVISEELRVNSVEKSSRITHHSSLISQFWFDPDIMEKILFNIISNAIKYTPAGGKILIAIGVVETRLIAPLQNQLVIKISDTGIGISPDHIDKIFDRFYRVKTRLIASQHEGTGIGLAYTKELVLLHNGTITVESIYGGGATFILQFPLGKDNYKKYTVSNKPVEVKLDYIHSMIETLDNEKDYSEDINLTENDVPQKQISEKEVVLLVEDNTDLRKFIKAELESEYKVLEAQNGQIGWEIAFKEDPGLIVSDIMMPVMDGVALCKKIKSDENTSHIPIILLTAKAGDKNTVEGLETGANDYITKPFNINVLKIKINNLFSLQKKLKEKFSQSINVVPSEITHSLIDQQFLQKAIDVVNENIQDIEFGNDKFVTLMNSSRSVIYRKIKNLTGQSVSEFIRSLRLKAAANLFLKGNLSVTDVCYIVGFKHPNVLTNYFTKMFGKSPTAFIKENLKISPTSSSDDTE